VVWCGLVCSSSSSSSSSSSKRVVGILLDIISPFQNSN